MRIRRAIRGGIESGFERAQPFAGVLGAGPQPRAAQAIKLSPAAQATRAAYWPPAV
jgi:hypothetical protein